ncbi:hypothetical protein X797_000760 [Metarhizium robertsii]|uniref:Uncharacterized protein n=1 Tax=Metarhizium robertsii TaxID=568076 RepID=A0A0A1V738_9HYPO|nr:hypothetical protein X797_000760 [Metarhizium robertsii]
MSTLTPFSGKASSSRFPALSLLASDPLSMVVFVLAVMKAMSPSSVAALSGGALGADLLDVFGFSLRFIDAAADRSQRATRCRVGIAPQATMVVCGPRLVTAVAELDEVLLGVDAAQMHMHMRMLRPRATVGCIFEVRVVELPANGGGRDGEAGVGGALSLWMAELLDPEGPHGIDARC